MLPILSAIAGVIPSIFSGIGEYFSHRMELKTLERQAEIEAAKLEVQQAGNADAEQVKDNKKSWKDEYVMMIVTLPIVACFIPPLQPYVAIGFKTLSTLVPEWYVGLYITVVLCVMGARTYMKYFKMPRNK